MKRCLLFVVISMFFSLSNLSIAQEQIRTSSQKHDTTRELLITTEGNILHIVNADIHSLLEVYNVLGVIVYSHRITSHHQIITLNLPKGCYIIKIKDITRKIAVK